jgi:lipopolysaccharide/colanic/teichoic acid biosynthesis glycosyltransferase
LVGASSPPPEHPRERRRLDATGVVAASPFPQPRQATSRRDIGVSTIHSSLAARIEKPAGMARRLIDWRYRMKQHLILLPLMIVIIVIEVKFVIKVIVKKR